MAGIASHLLEFPPSGNPSPGQYDTRIRAFVESLAKVDPGKIVKADQQQDFLQILDPQINSLAYLWVLSLRVKVFYQSKDQTQEQARSLLLQMSSFMQQFDSVQIRYVGNMLRETIEAALILAANLQQVGVSYLNLLIWMVFAD
jgi:COP9 signalosome complex subunit 3